MSDVDLKNPEGSDTADELPRIGLGNAVSKDSKPSTFVMVSKAIEANTDKKGATVSGIKKWIIGNYPEVDQNRLKLLMKKSLQKGLDSGEFLRPKKSSEVTSVMLGRYKPGKLPKKPKTVKKAKDLKTKKKKKTEKKGLENGGNESEGPPQTPPRRPISKKTKAVRRAHSLSPKIRQSKSKKVRRSISLTPGKSTKSKAKTTAITKPAAKKSPKPKKTTTKKSKTISKDENKENEGESKPAVKGKKGRPKAKSAATEEVAEPDTTTKETTKVAKAKSVKAKPKKVKASKTD